MDARAVPDEFDLSRQRALRQWLDPARDRVPLLASGLSARAVDALVRAVERARAARTVLWEHDWVELLTAGGLTRVAVAEQLARLAAGRPAGALALSPLDQGECDSCWAVASASAITDRFRVAYHDPSFPVLSPMTLMRAIEDAGCCEPYYVEAACGVAAREGLETWCCSPYSATTDCARGDGRCARGDDGTGQPCSSTPGARFHVRTTATLRLAERRGVPVAEDIKAELLARGTVIAEIILFPDFLGECAWRAGGAFAETGGIFVHSECQPRSLARLRTVARASPNMSAAQAEALIAVAELHAVGDDLAPLWSRSEAELVALFDSGAQRLAQLLPFLETGFYATAPRSFVRGADGRAHEVTYGQHALAVIGWGVARGVRIAGFTHAGEPALELPYWICRNSYGGGWCGDGYVRVAMSAPPAAGGPYYMRGLHWALGIDRVHRDTDSRVAVCPAGLRCGGVVAPGVPDLVRAPWRPLDAPPATPPASEAADAKPPAPPAGPPPPTPVQPVVLVVVGVVIAAVAVVALALLLLARRQVAPLGARYGASAVAAAGASTSSKSSFS